ncbi:hypothetical protein PMAYCL1PPCAC_00554 [Pristionchus mayeri]|uniref:Uncharacterized protein n=1 Tax=Pristionchus mayeri TaxID=1317129 RepID=A0AAN4YYW9_9BILA|nr:hypothetical protein PMAYCL1PPCAC_00554 [Pristionchus mayeri]
MQRSRQRQLARICNHLVHLQSSSPLLELCDFPLFLVEPFFRLCGSLLSNHREKKLVCLFKNRRFGVHLKIVFGASNVHEHMARREHESFTEGAEEKGLRVDSFTNLGVQH